MTDREDPMKTIHRINRILCLTVLAGCGASNKAEQASASYYGAAPAEGYAYADYEIATEEAFFAEEPMASMATADGADYKETTEVQTAGRKLIKTVRIDAETSNLYRFDIHLSQKVASLGGYIENAEKSTGVVRDQNLYDYVEDGRVLTEEEIVERSRWLSAYYVVRIPVENLNGFVDEIDNSANITMQNSNVDDVTLHYVDMQSKKDSLRTEQKRLTELLETAESIEDIITIEERLTQVRYELESIESKLRVMDNQIDYSTIYLDVRQVNRYTRVETPKSAGERIVQGFADSLEDVITGIKEFFIWVVIHLPYLVVFFAVAGFLLFLLIRFIRSLKDTPEKQEKRRRKREEQLRKKEERRFKKQQAKMLKEQQNKNNE